MTKQLQLAGTTTPPSSLAEQAARFGAAVMTDDGLLETLLAYAGQRSAAKVAQHALRHCGTLGDVLASDQIALQALGVEAEGRTLFAIVRNAATRMAAREIRNRPVLTNWQQLIDYCHVAMAHDPIEQARVLYLDRKNVLISDEAQGRGTVDHSPVYPREIMRRALALNASAIILVHNHPSGDTKPSQADIDMTREIRQAGEALGVALHDHIVIGRSGHQSFRSLGLIR